MSQQAEIDYALSGLTIQSAMLDHVKRFPDKRTRRKPILWGGLRIQTSDALPVPSEGRVRAEFLSANKAVQQGFDMKLHGSFELLDGKRVPLLRTWYDERYQDVVEYPFHCNDGLMYVWNIYEMIYANDHRVVERLTENAGFWIETISDTARIYHCSHGMAHPPDFGCLVFKVSIHGR